MNFIITLAVRVVITLAVAVWGLLELGKWGYCAAVGVFTGRLKR